jgi:hypothetical protein
MTLFENKMDPNEDQSSDELNPIWHLIANASVPSTVSASLDRVIDSFRPWDSRAVSCDLGSSRSFISSPWMSLLALSAITMWLTALVWSVRPSAPSASSDAISSASKSKPETDLVKPEDEAPESSTRGMFVAAKSTQKGGSLVNGSFETVGTDGRPTGWFLLPPRLEFRLETESKDVPHGDRCVKIHADPVQQSSSFVNLMQTVDASNYVGERVRFRAAVRIAGKGAESKAQLWLRADAPGAGNSPIPVLFDNMDERPIRSKEWKYFEIVGDVPKETTSISMGAFLTGAGDMWVDDASFEVVSNSIKVTTKPENTVGQKGGRVTAPERPTESAMIVLLGLVGACIGLVLMIASQLATGVAMRFSIVFAAAYWGLYTHFSSIPILGPVLTMIMQPFEQPCIRWVAANVLGVERELILPNGSGDTTYDYVRVLLVFCGSLLFAFAAVGLSRFLSSTEPNRRTLALIFDRLKGLLNVYVRYSLALILLGYGLAKLTSGMNQFPQPSPDQLLKPWGDCSPMNAVWTFMGISRPYTMFAGMTEVVPALLLLFRRTTFLGAAFAFGVLLNIFMLNMCYDVPVKQFSLHLLCMALFLLAWDTVRIVNVFLLNRFATPAKLGPNYPHLWMYAVHYVLKAVVIAAGVLLPISMTILGEFSKQASPFTQPELFGAYQVESMTREGQNVDLSSQDSWKRLHLDRYFSFDNRKPTDHLRLVTTGNGIQNFEIEYDASASKIASKEERAELTLASQADRRVTLNGTWDKTTVTVALRRIDREDFLLFNRGFRWINERPFNR